MDNSSHSESESSEYATDSNSGEENAVMSDGYTCVVSAEESHLMKLQFCSDDQGSKIKDLSTTRRHVVQLVYSYDEQCDQIENLNKT